MLPVLLDRPHVAVVVGQSSEERGRRRPAALDLVPRECEHLLSRRRGVRAARLVRLERVLGARVSEPTRDLRALGLDRRVPLQAEFVGLLRLQREGRPRQDRRRVDALAAGEGRDADRFRGVREVVAQGISVPGERRVHDVADHGRDALAILRAVAERDRGRRIGRVEREQSVELRDRSFRDDAGRRNARVDALARHLGPGLQERRERPQPPLVALELFGRRDRLHRRDLGERGHGTPEMGGRAQHVGPLFQLRHPTARTCLQHVEGPAHRVVEMLTIDRGELVERGAVQRLGGRPSRLARVRQPVVVAFVADDGAEDGFDLEQPVPIPVGERPCAFVVVHGPQAPGGW